jgi:hypothetical protein
MSLESPEPRAAKKKARASVAGRDSPFITATPGLLSTGTGDCPFFEYVKSAGLTRLNGLIQPMQYEQPMFKTLSRIDPVGVSALTLANCLADASYHVSYDTLIERVADEVATNKIIEASQYNGEDNDDDDDEGGEVVEELSQPLVDEWIAEARNEVYKMAWCFLCG